MNALKVWAVARKDIAQFFTSPLGYVVLFVYLLVTGFFFSLIVEQTRSASMIPVFQNTIIVLLFITPMITMRLWSEEEKSGTSELLLTSPLTEWDIVMGKYLAVCVFFGAMLAATLVYLLIMVLAGNPDLGTVLANYMGYALAAMLFFSIGLLASTLSENQIVSAVIAYGILLMLWVVGAAAASLNGALGDILKYLSIFEHLNDFFKGVLDMTHIFYFGSLIFCCLFLSVKVLEGKRS